MRIRFEFFRPPNLCRLEHGDCRDLSVMSRLVIQRECCKRAFLRGTFLAAGSISDPEKGYHLEIVCSTMERAEQIQSIMKEFELDARIVTRKKNQVVYLKEGSQIVDFLGVVEAGSALMNLENIRIRKEISNNINRKVNCRDCQHRENGFGSSKTDRRYQVY